MNEEPRTYRVNSAEYRRVTARYQEEAMKGARVIVTRWGRPQCVVISPEAFEEYRLLRERAGAKEEGEGNG